jgi:uncharacterized metal-binding protein YceD (DUF177 family)
LKNIHSPHSVTIKIRGLNQGENPVSLDFDAALLDYPGFEGIGKVEGILRRDSDRLTLDAEVSAEGNFECTRCADAFRDRISAPVTLHFVPPQLESNDGDPNVHVYDPLSDSEIDILPDVRDALILAIPMRHLCRPDCKGLCPACGKNLNREQHECHEQSEPAGVWQALNRVKERLRAEENQPDDRPIL